MPDLIIKIKIPASKVNDFKTAFKKVVVRPDALQGLTEIQFLKYYVKNSFKNIYKTGKMEIAKETTPPVIDDDILEVE